MSVFFIRLAVASIRAYQLALAPWSGGACRFTPSCSEYAMEVIRAHGVWRGAWLALARIGRCHPRGAMGFDPAPPARTPSEVPPRVAR